MCRIIAPSAAALFHCFRDLGHLLPPAQVMRVIARDQMGHLLPPAHLLLPAHLLPPAQLMRVIDRDQMHDESRHEEDYET